LSSAEEDLRRQIVLLKADLATKNDLIDILEKRIETLEKLGKYAVPDTISPSKEPLSSSKVKEELDLKNVSLGEVVRLYAKEGRETKSFRDELSSKGKIIPYDPNPIGRIGGKEVRIKKTAGMIFEQS